MSVFLATDVRGLGQKCHRRFDWPHPQPHNGCIHTDVEIGGWSMKGIDMYERIQESKRMGYSKQKRTTCSKAGCQSPTTQQATADSDLYLMQDISEDRSTLVVGIVVAKIDESTDLRLDQRARTLGHGDHRHRSKMRDGRDAETVQIVSDLPAVLGVTQDCKPGISLYTAFSANATGSRSAGR